MMKKLFLAALLAIPYLSNAQNFCGTVQTETDLTWLRNFQANHIPGEVRGGGPYYVPLKIHIVGTDDGSGYINVSTVMQNICDLNVQYEPVGFIFYLYEDIDYINNSSYYNHGWDDGYTMMISNNENDAVDMYYVSDPAGNCGYFSPAGHAVAIANGCGSIGNSTIAHELGHYFSLPHTFYGWEWGEPPLSDQEQVDGGNCNSAADGFCDTPSDYASWRWFCSSAPTFTDPDGVEFSPDGTYFMSYSDDGCQDKFSPDQIDAMNAYLQGPEDELLDHPAINYTDVDSATLVYPEEGAEDLFSNYVPLSWNAVEKAQGYVVQVAYTPSFSGIAYDIFTTDTFFICTNLVHDKKYYWRVKVVAEANSCEAASAYKYFNTGSEVLASVQNTDEETVFQVYPNPLTTGNEVKVSVMHEAGKNETILISDVTGKIIAEKVFVTNGMLQTISIELPQMAEGMYVVTISDGESLQSRKLIVTK